MSAPKDPLRGRQGSPALSDCSDLTVLSRSPSPPPEFLDEPTPTRAKIDQSSSYLVREALARSLARPSKRAAPPSSDERAAKIPRLSTQNLQRLNQEQDRPRKSCSSSISSKDSTAETSTENGATDALGLLRTFPKEVRQLIFGFCLDITTPVSLRQCCLPTSTTRERAACKKHGDRSSKIGIDNGKTPYDGGSPKFHGRFNILSVSSIINEEASWMLHTQGSLTIEVSAALVPYLKDKRSPNHYLASLRLDHHAKRMWMAVARYRNVRLELPHVLATPPTLGTTNLYNAATFLFKSWDLISIGTTSAMPRYLEVDLRSLYSGHCTDAQRRSESLSTRRNASIHFMHRMLTFETSTKREARTMERLVDSIGRRRELLGSRMVVEAPRSFDEAQLDAMTENNDEARAMTGMGLGFRKLRELQYLSVANDVHFTTRIINWV